ncbi:MAG TPA: hypothetical protein PKK50_00255 [Myxococcota bacterium]|nr:hypothetical protein [Myxococcota bacterium]
MAEDDADSRDEEGGGDGKPEPSGQMTPEMAELMLKLAEIRRSVSDSDETRKRLLKQIAVILFFMAAVLLLPLVFTGSCQPPG